MFINYYHLFRAILCPVNKGSGERQGPSSPNPSSGCSFYATPETCNNQGSIWGCYGSYCDVIMKGTKKNEAYYDIKIKETMKKMGNIMT